MKPYYPIMLDLSNKLCVVVGGGSVAERKIEKLLTANARVIVISPEATDKIAFFVEHGLVAIEKKEDILKVI